jgi:serine/threonine protein kinase/tetratricopeptide (TPR) repeat protein
MTPERWQRLEAVLRGAIELDADTRDSYLRQSCGDDEELRREAESLLAFEPHADSLILGAIQAAAAEFQTHDPVLASGERVGVYRIVREIGRGGMGTVYLAERDDEHFEKQVAIKVVTHGMNTEQLLRRFRRERQILARLDHPFIARLLDGGTTEDGRPFLVMEYVQGAAITSYCDEHHLGTRRRIELFLKVCAAVQSAHQNLVVHRDLKPGNILVDSEGSPKLLDFGIAKLLGPDESGDVTMALGGMQMFTPQYASPEQVLGEAIAAAADTYVLGVILYELLTGVRPYEIRSFMPNEIFRAVCEEQPERPSTAWRKRAALRTLRAGPVLKADELDNIILMAMRKEPAQRYGSVAEFAADLQRYLDGRPVKARDATLTYRVRKFIRRHGAMVTAAALVVITLAAGAVVSTLEARRAQRRFDEVRRMAHAVLYDIHDAIRDLPGSLKARELVVKTALQYLDGLAAEARGDPDLQLEMAEAYQRVGDVQGSAFYSSLRHSGEATLSYGKAKRIADELSRRDPNSARANLIRMAARESLADVRALQGDIEGSLALYREGEEIGEAVVRRDPGNLQVLRSLAELYRASAREDQNNPRGIASARKSLALFQRLAAAQPDSEEAQADQANAHSELSSVLEVGNHFEEAVEEERKNLRIYEKLATAHPLNVHYKHELKGTYEKLGDAASGTTSAATTRPRDTPEALDSYRKAVALSDALVAADPADRTAREERGMALMKLGMTIPPEKDLNAAVTTLRRAQQDFQFVADAQPGEARVLRRLAATYMYIGRRLATTGHTPDAAPNLREAIRITDTVLRNNPNDLLALNYSWRSSQVLAKALAAQHQRSDALYFSGKAITSAESARAADGANPVTQSFLPQAYAIAGEVRAVLATAPGATVGQRREDWGQAREFYQKSVDAWEQIQTGNAGRTDWAAQLAHSRAEVKRCAAAAVAAH